MICPDLKLMQAAGRAERFRLEIAKLTFESEPNLSITTSFGVAESETGDCLEDILKRSDQALYQSKEEGRNRTSVLRRQEMSDQAVQNIAEEDFTFSAEINAMLQKEILVMKLKGYVHDQKAKLISIEEGYAVIQVGQKSFFSKWGKKEQRQPIRIELDASDAINPANSNVKNKKLKVKISPVGQPGSVEIFQYRARKALHEMSFYFLC
ncbi:MAG: diguanylate cyclase [Planctomycetaceae bacterium]|nr:diguanylate cyclase [Planctomycetaceae bacterium]